MGEATVISFPRPVPAVTADDVEDRSALPTRPAALWKPATMVTAVWLGVVGATAVMGFPPPAVRHVGLFVHVLSLAVGFGAVVVLDAYGLLWLLGRRCVADVVRLVEPAHVLICLGMVGLLTSGMVLHPDLGSPPAKIKLALVLVVMLNGLNAHRFARRLHRLPHNAQGKNIPWPFVTRALSAGVVSQIGWWGAIVIGFLTTSARGG